MLFTERSLPVLLHGVAFGGGALMALAAMLFTMGALMRPGIGPEWLGDSRARAVGWLIVGAAAVLWLTVISGTYVVFPPYRATPPAGVTDLAAYPRALLLSKPETAWLHRVAMEMKEHMPWIAAMLATAVAFVTWRHPHAIWRDRWVRRTTLGLLAVSFVLTALAGVLGIFANKIAPLQ